MCVGAPAWMSEWVVIEQHREITAYVKTHACLRICSSAVVPACDLASLQQHLCLSADRHHLPVRGY